MTQLRMRHYGPLSGFVFADGVEIASNGDATSLAALMTEAFDELWTAARVDEELLCAEEVRRTWCIRDRNRIMATASELYPRSTPGSAIVHYVAVAVSARGRRLGELITRQCLAGFAANGYDQSCLQTDDVRVPAIVTYLRLGFVPQYPSDDQGRIWASVLSQLVKHKK